MVSDSRFYGFDTRHSTVTLYNKMYARIAIFFGYTVSYYEFILTNLFNAQTLYMGTRRSLARDIRVLPHSNTPAPFTYEKDGLFYYVSPLQRSDASKGVL